MAKRPANNLYSSPHSFIVDRPFASVRNLHLVRTYSRVGTSAQFLDNSER